MLVQFLHITFPLPLMPVHEKTPKQQNPEMFFWVFFKFAYKTVLHKGYILIDLSYLQGRTFLK